MSKRSMLAAVCLTSAAPLVVSLLATSADAGSLCDTGRAVECYEKVATPDVYQTIERPVIVAPARTEVVREAAITTTRTERLETSPGQWIAEKVPAQFGVVERTVQVRPASVVYDVAPAQYRSIRQTVVVRPASYRWERQLDRHGRETMCKIVVPAVMRDVERSVQIAPATRIARTIPAEYRTVRQTIQVAPETVRRSYVPPRYQDVERTVVLRPAMERVVERPAVIAVAQQQVLVQKGAVKWQRARTGLFD